MLRRKSRIWELKFSVGASFSADSKMRRSLLVGIGIPGLGGSIFYVAGPSVSISCWGLHYEIVQKPSLQQLTSVELNEASIFWHLFFGIVDWFWLLRDSEICLPWVALIMVLKLRRMRVQEWRKTAVDQGTHTEGNWPELSFVHRFHTTTNDLIDL